MLRSLSPLFIGILLLGLTAKAVSHTYFFAITDLSINTKSQRLEVIHQLTAHDLDNAIAQVKQIHFSSAHPDYDKYLRQYLAKHFNLFYNNQEVKLEHIGYELNKGKVFIYQQSIKKINFAGLVVKNDLLVDTYPKQVNTVNYQDNAISGSLTFTESQRIIKIDHKN